jgi:hypothetical protein
MSQLAPEPAAVGGLRDVDEELGVLPEQGGEAQLGAALEIPTDVEEIAEVLVPPIGEIAELFRGDAEERDGVHVLLRRRAPCPLKGRCARVTVRAP